MAELPLQRFIALVALDQKINQIEVEIEQVGVHINQAQQRLALHDAAVEKTRLSQTHVRKQVDELELTMKEYDAQEKEKRARMEEASNQRQYDSFKTELDRLNRLQYDLEGAVVKAWQELETFTKELEQREQEAVVEKGKLDIVIQDYLQQEAKLKDQLQELERTRPAAAEGMPDEWLEKYAIMKKQVSNPVVPIRQESCSACFYLLSQQDRIRLAKGAILQCKDCYRFLYTPAEHLSSDS